jgi:hypothetical protein
MWINDGSLAKQSYAHAFAWSNESTFQKRDTSNIFILRCSFHKTAERLSITSLTRLSRLHTKIQSSIVRHNKMSALVIPVILLQTKKKRKKKLRGITKHQLSKLTTKFPPPFQKKGEKKKKKKNHGLDYFTKNQFPEGIQLSRTIISQIYRKKKICLQALTIQTSIAYLCDTTMKGKNCLFHTVMLY